MSWWGSWGWVLTDTWYLGIVSARFKVVCDRCVLCEVRCGLVCFSYFGVDDWPLGARLEPEFWKLVAL
jgi:hypothetical protein